MRRLKYAIAVLSVWAGPAVAETPARPNFLIIVADDLGYSDLGAFGGEIDTPNLDAIAKQGVRLTAFHTAPTCSPTRSMLLSGTDNHKAGLGTMAELIAPNQKGKPGFEGYLRPEVATLAELLVAGGYRTLYSGKWHLGLTPAQDPSARGFQHSFTLLQGGHNHFGVGVSDDPIKGSTYRENGKAVAKLPDNFYSSDTFATKLIDQIRATKSGAEGAKPFFAYLAFTAPHWPLQAHPEDIAKYRGRYNEGFEVLRAKRLKRQAELGLIDASRAAHPPVLKNGGWNALSPEQKRTAARDMEIYAAMVDRLDRNVGRVVEALKATGEYDNTVILFLADNGAEALDINATEMVGIKDRAAAADNSFANRGTATSYIGYGPGWAQAATAPSWLYKAYATEGGTRAVAFINHKDFSRQGSIGTPFLTVADVVPTFLDLAGVPDHKGQFQGRTVEPIRGKSWVPWLAGKAERVYAPGDAIGTELFGSRALRQGDWKITDTGDGQWKLFNIVEDPGETRDLSVNQPARRAELIAHWDAYAKDVGVIIPDQRIYRP
ncbi:arylsulfatase [Sphingomonas cavernae]|uniref:Arylsulfatase n=1 Tax=Sphingomonas cavernae TaxID=2320861 RepID=A0A418W726_9SPHN|nr:arylsulfatase [Sphingomonas cavernae]RJF85812.1 arylsulfatase [Sphingomonas cavernae]